MRILAAADIHGVLPVYDWLMEQARRRRADLVLLAGDLFSADWDGQHRQVAPIAERLRKSPAPILYLMGNDDEMELGLNEDRIQPLHGRMVEAGGFRFAGYQYTPPFFGVRFVKTEEEMAQDMPLMGSLVDERTVLLTHAPARGTLDQVRGEHVGSRALERLVAARRPLAHVHGHIHECFGREGQSFNVAAAGKRRAMLIELPALNHEQL